MYCSNHAAYNLFMGSGERAAAAKGKHTGCIEISPDPTVQASITKTR